VRGRPTLMFSSTVSSRNTRLPSGTRHRPARDRSHADADPRSLPASDTDPETVGSTPATPNISVVLPAPLRPTTAVISPARAVNETSQTATRSPYANRTSLTSSSGALRWLPFMERSASVCIADPGRFAIQARRRRRGGMTVPEIARDNGLVAPDLLRRTACDDRAKLHHVHGVGGVHHER